MATLIPLGFLHKAPVHTDRPPPPANTVHLLTVSRTHIPSAGDASQPSASFLLRKVRGGVNIWARQGSREAEGCRISSRRHVGLISRSWPLLFLPSCDRRAKAALTSLDMRTRMSGVFMRTLFPTRTMAAVCRRQRLRAARKRSTRSERIDSGRQKKKNVDKSLLVVKKKGKTHRALSRCVLFACKRKT